MYIKVSWDKEFEELMLYLKLKYKDRMFNADGIGDDALDLNKFSKSFFTNNTTAADVSVDANSNVTAKTSVEYTFELPKPLKRLNSYFLLWKQLKKQFDIDFANKVIEMQLSGDIYINDFTDIAMPYSYHPDTSILLDSGVYTIKKLFDKYSSEKNIKPDREDIDLRDKHVLIWDGNKFIKVLCVLRHKSHTDLIRFITNKGHVFIVTEDHPVITKLNRNGKCAKDININDDELIDLPELPEYSNKNIDFNIITLDNFSENYPMWDEHYRREFLISLLNGCYNKKLIEHHDTYTTIKIKSFEKLNNFKLILKYNNYKIKNVTFNNNFYFVDFILDNDIDVIFNTKKYEEYALDTTEDTYQSVRIISKDIIEYKNKYVYDIQTESGIFSSDGLMSHNCFNYSTNDVAYNGLKGISRRLDVKPPKSFNTFIRQVEQFVVYAANSTLGATGLADILVVGSHFVKKIKETGYDGHIKVNDIHQYIYEILVNFIYTLNWEYRGNQSPFTNISIYDDYFLDNFINDYHSPIDGQPPDKEVIKFLQDIFINAMNDELSRNPITFPVTTACFSVITQDDLDSGKWNGFELNEAKDKNFVKYIAEKNKKFCFINMYAGETSQLSSC